MNNIEGNKLVFSNSTHKDVFLNEELIDMLGKNNVVFTLTQEKHSDYEYGRIDKDIILKNSKEIDYYYICGPLSFQEDIIKTLKDMSIGDEKIVIESW